MGVLALGIPINSEWIYLRSEPLTAGTFVGVSLSFFHIFDDAGPWNLLQNMDGLQLLKYDTEFQKYE